MAGEISSEENVVSVTTCCNRDGAFGVRGRRLLSLAIVIHIREALYETLCPPAICSLRGGRGVELGSVLADAGLGRSDTELHAQTARAVFSGESARGFTDRRPRGVARREWAPVGRIYRSVIVEFEQREHAGSGPKEIPMIRVLILTTMILGAARAIRSRSGRPPSVFPHQGSALKLKGIIDLDSPQFGLDENCRIRRAKYFCIPTSKSVNEVKDGRDPLDPLPFVGSPAPGDRICYTVSCPKRDLPDQFVSDQFWPADDPEVQDEARVHARREGCCLLR